MTAQGYGVQHEPKALPAVVFAIDEFKVKKLMNDNYIDIQGAQITEQAITFTRDGPKRRDSVRIDRRTGEYREDRTVKGEPVTAVVIGECEKLESRGGKF